MCKSLQNAKGAACELSEKLSVYDWFIGIIVAPQKPHDFIVCSRKGNAPEVIAAVRSHLRHAELFDGNVVVGLYDNSFVKVFAEKDESAEKFYRLWCERQARCSGKFGMGG